MVKQKLQNSSIKISFRQRLVIGALLLVLGFGSVATSLVYADDFQQKIDALNKQNAQNQQNVEALEVQADSYEDAINKLQKQISALQKQISANEKKKAQLEKEIKKAQIELEKQKDLLGQNIKAMYLEGQISTLEMLASSKDLSDFVDKEQYRNSVKDKIKATLDKITALKLQLKSQKDAVDRLLMQQKNLQDKISSSQREQRRLLAFTESQKADYENKIKKNNSRIAELRQQQILANMRNSIGGRVGSPTNGYYPYDNWPFSMREGAGCVDGDGPDRWGYCTRQCVSYAAWAVERSGRRAPMYYGNANNWDNAGSRYAVSSPKAGDVAVDNSGTWGHVMYVEAVGTKNGRQAIYVSQYNAGLRGEYTEEWKYASGYVYLRFK